MSATQKPRIVALGKPRYVGEDYLAEFQKDFNYSVLEAYDRATTQRLLAESIARDGPIDGFIIRMGTPPYEPFDMELLSSLAPNCRIITSASAGYNEFDVEWMTSQGMYFCNTVDAVAESTADMAIFLILGVLRNTTNAERQAREGSWRADLVPTADPSGKALGIVGLGAIGKYLAKKAAVFNMRILYHNRNRLSPEDEKIYGLTYCETLHQLLQQSDVVSINCPLNAQTEGLIGKEEFAVMKDGAYFINTARGPIVDESSLIEALESGKVTRAGLDVFANEPNVNSYFKTSNKVIVQPHLGGLTDVSFGRAERECFENIKALFAHGKPNSPVNTPL
ncbi:D-mandelate dehydrogenase-like dehydrogenase [Aspergillus brunneoviolaceus CBS 621.78]|uniref:2-hydroxyacid dehydrogenase n=1 Tax=Aspergillus brunneoviolaceus CBS 621.78 TaxID=1450534 RepID=A0ACD1G0Z7_9EURO|nr:putative 2-hydroxyacid dehydrogenase [Aspergillus brunneoviolaceus CBS 621.78]RAH42909.1 putative 2-hydroxyacid dehydrogenase [Aspergillus brunneoviolaceus CBS 621.78]